MRISDWSSDVCSSDLKGLQRLYGVARFGSDERAAHDRIEVDKAAFAHEAVEKGLADTIARGETPQRGDLIGCIMIDAGLRIRREAITKKRKQPFERLRFGGMVMSPEGMETIIGPHAVQIFKASLVMGVALAVVEEIARLRQRGQIGRAPGGERVC